MGTLARKKRILFITHAFGHYGSERSMLDFLKILDRDEYEPFVLLKKKGYLYEELRRMGVEVDIYPMQQWIVHPRDFARWHFRVVFFEMPKRVKYIMRMIESKSIDLVYTNSILVVDGVLAAKLKKIPNIIHVRELLGRNPNLRSYLPLFLVTFLVRVLADRIITVSNVVKEILKSRFGWRINRKIKVVHNGVDFTRFIKLVSGNSIDALRDELGLRKGTKVVTLIGRFAETKGQIDFINAASHIVRDFPDVRFIILGSGSKTFLTTMIDELEKLGLTKKFTFLGARANLFPVYEVTDILVSASWVESFGLTIVEAMANKVPVVSTRCGGPEEIIIDGETGFLVPVRAPEELAEAVLKLLKDAYLCLKIGESGYQRAFELFNGSVNNIRVRDIIDTVLARDGKRQNSRKQKVGNTRC